MKDSNEGNTKVEVAEGKVLYNVVRNAFREAGMTFYPNPNTTVSNNNNNITNNTQNKNNNNNNYHFEIKNDRAVLVWFDTIRDLDYFSILKPWQVVNRLPQANVICRKAPFVRIIQRIQPFFPQLYQFLPKSYILPIQKDQFIQVVAKHDRKYIIKPDNGSLGAGIIILEKKMSYSPTSYLAIAQEYIESYLIDQTKFDLRIYCLVSSINPLKIFVYRGGVARFCSQPVDSTDSVFSQLTNTAVNKTNPNIQKIDSITQMVNDVFEKLRIKDKVDIDALWKRIDKAITLTILAAYNYLLHGEEEVCKPCGYSRCFQIFGFDVLLDQKLTPIIMEVNYRPSLETDTQDENTMKCDMLSTAMKIAAPLNDIQNFMRSKFLNDKSNSSGYDQHNGAFTISELEWNKIVNDEFSTQIQKRLENTLNENKDKFVQTYPCINDDLLNKQYNEIIEKVKTFPTTYEERFKLPIEMKNYVSYNNPVTVNTIKVNNDINTKKESTSHLPPISQKSNQPQNNLQQQNQQNRQQTQFRQPIQSNISQKSNQQNQQIKIQSQTQQNKQQQQIQQNKLQQTQPNKPQQTQQNKPQQIQQNKPQQTQQNKPQQNQQNKPQQTQQNKPQQNQQNKPQQTQQNKPQQTQQNKPQQTQQNKPQQTQQNKPQQTQQNKPQQTQQNKPQQTQQNKPQQTQQNKQQQSKPQQPQQSKPQQPQQPQQSKQNKPNPRASLNNLNINNEGKRTTSSANKRTASSKRESSNSYYPSNSEKIHPVTRPNSNKTVHICSNQSMTKTMNPNTSIKTTKDSISNSYSTGTVKSFATTNSKINNNKIRTSASLVKTNVRSSSSKKPKIVKKTELSRLPKP